MDNCLCMCYYANELMPTQTASTATQVHFRHRPCACFIDNVASFDIEAMTWLAQDGRVQLSYMTRSILLSLVTYLSSSRA